MFLGSELNAARSTTRQWCEAAELCLYGWDGRSNTWHGPNELGCTHANRRLLHGLRSASAQTWHGSLRCSIPPLPACRFFVQVHDLSDCAVASIYCDESKAGPAEIIAVLPSARRGRLRHEFAFEFLAHARFLGAVSAGAELEVHEGITEAVAEWQRGQTLVFSIGSGLLPAEMDPVLSCCAEEVAVTVGRWLDELSA